MNSKNIITQCIVMFFYAFPKYDKKDRKASDIMQVVNAIFANIQLYVN